MALDTESVPLSKDGVAVYTAQHRSILADKATYQLKEGQGKLAQIVVSNVGSSWTVDIYDDIATTAAKKIWEYVTADGKGTFAVQIPCKTGIRVVSGGTTAGLAVIVWD